MHCLVAGLGARLGHHFGEGGAAKRGRGREGRLLGCGGKGGDFSVLGVGRGSIGGQSGGGVGGQDGLLGGSFLRRPHKLMTCRKEKKEEEKKKIGETGRDEISKEKEKNVLSV